MSSRAALGKRKSENLEGTQEHTWTQITQEESYESIFFFKCLRRKVDLYKGRPSGRTLISW